MNLNTPVEKLFMVGPAYAKRLAKLDIKTVEDLLYHFPFRYHDYSLISLIAKIQPGEIVTLRGKVITIKNEYTKSGKKIQRATVADSSGQIEVIWFNQTFLPRILKRGVVVSLSGKVDWFGRKITLVSPEYEIIHSTQKKKSLGIHTGRLVPIYHETRGVSSKWLRSRIAPLLESLNQEHDFLPFFVKDKHNLAEWSWAIRQIHFPQDEKKAAKAQKRLAFEEMFLIHLQALSRKRSWHQKKLAYRLQIDGEKMMEFMGSLPFELTKAQERVLKEIFADLKKSRPMNRLLEGDVGAGKTVVAAAAIYAAFLSGTQSALMAPTEILANQHFETLSRVLTPLGLKTKLLTSGSRKKIEEFDLAVGTHALIHKKIKFKKLGLAVIDEQHRFGVEQRAKLIKQGKAPHILSMTATPIPRTIALTLYGDLDFSVIDELPPGRQAVKTWVVPPQKRTAAYEWVKKQIKNKPNQAFIVCPIIEESAHETMQSVRAVTSEFNQLKKEVFSDLKLGLLHGRLKSKEKNSVIEKFKKGKLDILVSTPVVEVGIDIPTATIMIIEAAERFGLAQLHQLRGRVGRGTEPSYCLLFTEIRSQKILQRLKALEKTNVGIKLAEIDLKLRGPGQIYGTIQHGFFDLKIASFNDLDLIEKTKKAALKIVKKSPFLANYPLLKDRLKKDTIKEVRPN